MNFKMTKRKLAGMVIAVAPIISLLVIAWIISAWADYRVPILIVSCLTLILWVVYWMVSLADAGDENA